MAGAFLKGFRLKKVPIPKPFLICFLFKPPSHLIVAEFTLWEYPNNFLKHRPQTDNSVQMRAAQLLKKTVESFKTPFFPWHQSWKHGLNQIAHDTEFSKNSPP